MTSARSSRARSWRASAPRLAVTLAHKEYRPDFTVQAGYMNRGGLAAMWQAGVGMTLPVYRKGLRAGAAEAERGLTRGQRARLESLRAPAALSDQERLTRAEVDRARRHAVRRRASSPRTACPRGGARQLPVGQGAVRRGARGADSTLRRPWTLRSYRASHAQPAGQPRRGKPRGERRDGPRRRSGAGSELAGAMGGGMSGR